MSEISLNGKWLIIQEHSKERKIHVQNVRYFVDMFFQGFTKVDHNLTKLCKIKYSSFGTAVSCMAAYNTLNRDTRVEQLSFRDSFTPLSPQVSFG